MNLQSAKVVITVGRQAKSTSARLEVIACPEAMNQKAVVA